MVNPLRLVEEFFKVKVSPQSLTKFDEFSLDTWIEFAKFYAERMKKEFVIPAADPQEVRLYFEPSMSHDWHDAVAARFSETPLLGRQYHPPTSPVTDDVISDYVNPLKKHLLIANAAYIRDNFYYCFDAVADQDMVQQRWRADPNIMNLVQTSVIAVKNWLPILARLRKLIESGALVFMPYYITPSFPYEGVPPQLKEHEAKIRVRAEPGWTVEMGFWQRVVGAWLNARLMALDPVFPTKEMADLASLLYFHDGSEDVASDLISIEILPFGDEKGMSLETLWKLRKNEAVFHEIQKAVGECKSFLERNMRADADRAAVSRVCREFLRDKLADYDRGGTLRFLDEHRAGSLVFGIAVGAAIAAPPLGIPWALGAIAGGLASQSPGYARSLQKLIDPKRRAVGRLQSLL